MGLNSFYKQLLLMYMKKNIKKSVLALSGLAIATLINLPAKAAAVSPYVGVNLGAIYGNAQGNYNQDSSQASGSFKTGKKTASTAGLALGIEGGETLKFGAEIFANQGFAFKSTENSVQGEIRYQDPLYYGLKGKILFNIGDSEKGIAPYIVAGVGQERAKLTRSEKTTYTNEFWLGGLGIQGKIGVVGVYAEGNYLKSFKEEKNVKTESVLAVVGVRFYFN
jgi:hypothetical protein